MKLIKKRARHLNTEIIRMDTFTNNFISIKLCPIHLPIPASFTWSHTLTLPIATPVADYTYMYMQYTAYKITCWWNTEWVYFPYYSQSVRWYYKSGKPMKPGHLWIICYEWIWITYIWIFDIDMAFIHPLRRVMVPVPVTSTQRESSPSWLVPHAHTRHLYGFRHYSNQRPGGQQQKSISNHLVTNDI